MVQFWDENAHIRLDLEDCDGCVYAAKLFVLLSH